MRGVNTYDKKRKAAVLRALHRAKDAAESFQLYLTTLGEQLVASDVLEHINIAMEKLEGRGGS